MTEPTAKEVFEFLDELNSTLGTLSMADIVNLFQYQGFNPQVILATFLERGKNATKKTYPYNKQNRVVAQDLRNCLILALHRGTKLAKITNKTGDEGKKVIQDLVDTYKIVSTEPGNSGRLEAKTLTFARIAAAAALHTCRIAHMPGTRIIGTLIDGLPKGYHWPGGASMIPSDKPDLLKLWKAYSVSFNKVINPKDDDEKALANAEQYGNIMWSNTFYSDDVRTALLKELQNPGKANKVATNTEVNMSAD